MPTLQEHNYILAMIDQFSSWFEAVPLKIITITGCEYKYLGSYRVISRNEKYFNWFCKDNVSINRLKSEFLNNTQNSVQISNSSQAHTQPAVAKIKKLSFSFENLGR